MMLSQLIPDRPVPDLLIRGICEDSRSVRQGDLFCALPGRRFDGRDFIGDAIDKGAVAVLTDSPADRSLKGAPIIHVDDLRWKLGAIASRYFGEPSAGITLFAVTGTNGKTSFTHFLSQALASRGVQCGLIGTMGHGRPGDLRPSALTTPSAPDLQRRIRELVASGCTAVALEASSHGLAQGRLHGTSIDTAVLTNLTHDHLDYHESFAAYRRAKQMLFQFGSVRHAVINLDDPWADELTGVLDESVRVFTFSLGARPADVRLSSRVAHRDGFDLEIEIGGERVRASLPLYGGFNVQNVLAVIGSLLTLDWTPAEIAPAVASLSPVAGRMDVTRVPGRPTLVVDYAHTPDALEQALVSVREHFPAGAVCCVFGCGGERDRQKRPVMGELAARLSDRLVITSDNPRGEDPAAIISDIEQGIGCGSPVTLIDRAAAIRHAIDSAAVGDVVLIAGKGHEDYQELASGRIAFSDYQAIAAALKPALAGRRVIVGLGETGLSYARFLAARGEGFLVLDDNPGASRLAELRGMAPGAQVEPITHAALLEAEQIYVSPGVPLALPALEEAAQRGIPLKGDVQMFGEMAAAPLVAITGTNGKSTVAGLTFEMARAQLPGVVLAGNIGRPCLDALSDDARLYILELSSYQLELARDFPARIAAVLNLSPDHLDRYPDLDAYYNTKLSLLDRCEAAVVNRALNLPPGRLAGKRVATFGADAAAGEGHFGLTRRGDEWLLAHGGQPLLAAGELRLAGGHNLENVLAALAIGWLLELDLPQMLEAATRFEVLPHRGECVAEIAGVRYVNDSKATNPGAMLASVRSLARNNNVVLIAGGDTKGLSFDGMGRELEGLVKAVLLIGESAEALLASFSGLPAKPCHSLEEAVAAARSLAVAGDTVLLSPGCASFDQFDDYAARGDAFRRAAGGSGS